MSSMTITYFMTYKINELKEKKNVTKFTLELFHNNWALFCIIYYNV